MIQVIRYEASLAARWDQFVAGSKNGTFLFFRNYMDYHSDRFADHSLLFLEDDELVALLPASVEGEQISSHGGLTYGGLVTGPRMRAPSVLTLFDAMLGYYRSAGIRSIVYKPVPHIYHTVPAEEDLYALFRFGARLARRDLASTIRLAERLPISKGRKWSVNVSKKKGVEVQRSVDFQAFMAMEAQLLNTKYGVDPVHTAAEMELLSSRFPNHIKLFAATHEGKLAAGTIVYETKTVVHTQYIASTPEGRQAGALDAVFNHLINEVYPTHLFFDFGTSTEQAGTQVNEGLLDNKESWGARATVYDRYELAIS